jgi:hypothetical protein
MGSCECLPQGTHFVGGSRRGRCTGGPCGTGHRLDRLRVPSDKDCCHRGRVRVEGLVQFRGGLLAEGSQYRLRLAAAGRAFAISLPQGHARKYAQGVLVGESLCLFMPLTNVPGVFAR